MDMVNNTNVATLGIVGSLLIFWTVISVMGKIERTFNTIWGVKNNRPLVRKFADYISVLLVVPLLLLATSSLTAVLSSNLLEPYLGPLFPIYQGLAPYFNILPLIIAFSFLYIYLPNTKVKLLPALTAGIFTAILWQLTQWVYIRFQVGVANYNVIYASFSSIPLFFAWLYTSWVLILFGGELSFAVQNYRTFEDESRFREVSHASLHALAFLLVAEIAECFYQGRDWQISDFSDKQHVPFRLINQVLQSLVSAHVLACTDEKLGKYLPAKDLSQLTFEDLELAVKGRPEKMIDSIHSPYMKVLEETYQSNADSYLASLKKINLKQIVEENISIREKN